MHCGKSVDDMVPLFLLVVLKVEKVTILLTTPGYSLHSSSAEWCVSQFNLWRTHS